MRALTKEEFEQLSTALADWLCECRFEASRDRSDAAEFARNVEVLEGMTDWVAQLGAQSAGSHAHSEGERIGQLQKRIVELDKESAHWQGMYANRCADVKLWQHREAELRAVVHGFMKDYRISEIELLPEHTELATKRDLVDVHNNERGLRVVIILNEDGAEENSESPV